MVFHFFEQFEKCKDRSIVEVILQNIRGTWWKDRSDFTIDEKDDTAWCFNS